MSPDTDALLTTTRSVRMRLDLTRPVDLATIDECLEVATQAPNGSGKEQWRFLVVSDAALRAEIGRLYSVASESYLQQLRSQQPDLDESSRSFRSSKFLWDHLGEVPVHVIGCVEREPWHLVEHPPASAMRSYIDASVYGSIFPALWSFQLACRSRGLGTCAVTSILKFEPELRALLGIPAHFAAASLVAVAHTSGEFRRARRRPLDEVRRFDRWA